MMPDVAPAGVSASPKTAQVPVPLPKPPELTATPRDCNACDMMVTLGLLASSCEDIDDPTKRSACKELLKPLEDGKDSAVDALANVIVALGEDHLDSVTERMNLIIYAATAKARERLIETGVLNKDGTPKVTP